MGADYTKLKSDLILAFTAELTSTDQPKSISRVSESIAKAICLQIVEGENGYTLSPATATVLGGIKVGLGLSVSEDGTVQVSSNFLDKTVADTLYRPIYWSPDLSAYSTKQQNDTYYLGINATAQDSIKLGGQLPSYYQPAGNYESILTFSTGLNRVGSIITNTITQYTDAMADIRVAHGISGKQDVLNGIGLVRMDGGIVSYDNNTYLTSFTESDPIFTAWDKKTGISITKSQITDFPTSLRNPYALTIKQDEFTSKTYDGSLAITIDYASLGAAPSVHYHNGYEPFLNTPPVSGYVLSSTTNGARSWVAAGIQVQTDWNATTGLGVLLNKPTKLSQFSNDLGNYGGFVTGTPWTSAGYLTAITKAQVEAVLTGAITSHTHNYLSSFTETDPIFTAWDKKTGISITKSQVSDFPTSMPASDVSAWAKLLNKPSYGWNEIQSKPTTLSGYGITDAAPLSGGANYIQNQNSSAQSANMWISGSANASKLITTSGGNPWLSFVSTNTTTTNRNWDLISNYFAWGDFDLLVSATANTTPSLSVLNFKNTGAATFASTVNATQLQSTVATGTAPLTVNSTTMVSNLNAEYAGSLRPLAINSPVDLNTMGFGRAANYADTSYWTNAPLGLSYGSVYNFGGDGEAHLSLQLAADIVHNSTNSTRNLWFRTSNNLGFQNDWKLLYHSGNLTANLTTNYIPKWNGSSMVNSLISSLGTGVQILPCDNTRATLRLNSTTDVPTDLYFANNGVDKWSWTSRGSSSSNSIYLYSTSGKAVINFEYANGDASIYSTTQSTSPTTGALVVSGGIGVGGGIYSSNNIITDSNVNGDVANFNGFVKSGGTSSQFLKADGSVDATNYQPTITLTTNGTSGAATFSGGTLNVPNYGTSGTYTASINAVNNISNPSITASYYTKTGNIYSSTLKGNVTTTAVSGSACQFSITLPTTPTSSSSIAIIPSLESSTEPYISAISSNTITIAFTNAHTTGWTSYFNLIINYY